MVRKRMALFLGTFLSVLILTGLAAGVTVEASSTVVPPTPDGSSSSSAPAAVGEIFAEGYDCYADEALTSPLSRITPGQNVWVKVRVTDKRENFSGFSFEPIAHVNSAAFTRLKPPEAGLNDANIFGLALDAQGHPTYELVLPVRYNGTGKTFAFDLYYSGFDGVPMYTFSREFSQCVETASSSSTASDSQSTSVRGTGFVMKSASYGGGNIQVGGSFRLDVVLLSTNGSRNVENVYVSITPSKEIALAGGNSVMYIGTVAPNQEIPVSFDLEAGTVETEGTYKVTLTVKGVDSAGTAVEAAMDIAIPVVFAERFEIFNMQIPDTITVNASDGSGYTSLTLVNRGKGIIHNVSAEVIGEGVTAAEGKQFIGNINAGAQGTVEFNLVADQPGQHSGQIVISYENAKGDVKQLTHDFSVDAQEAQDIFVPMPGPEEPEQQGMPMWGWLLIALGGAAVIAVLLIVLLKRRKAKRAAALMDEYEESEDETV